MCFNETASIVALSIGITFSVILLYYNHIAYAGLLFVITLMQLYEYFAHHSIVTKNKNLNVLATKLIYIGVVIQPVVYAIFNTYFLPKYCNYNFPQIVKSFPWLILSYIAYSIFLFIYMNNNNMFITKYLTTPCTSICRLNWFDNMKSYMFTILLVIFFILYLSIMALYSFYDSKLPVQSVISIFLVIAFIYTFFILKLKMSSGISVFGSIWCFLSVFMGPYVLYFKSFSS
jgi:hypothetical protein